MVVNRSTHTHADKDTGRGGASVCVYLHCCVASSCAVPTLTAQTSRKPTHALQSGADVRQEGAQHPLLVRPGTALNLLQADAAQRVTAGPRLKTVSRQPSCMSDWGRHSLHWLPLCFRVSGVTAGVEIFGRTGLL